jgi:hypothetical protein
MGAAPQYQTAIAPSSMQHKAQPKNPSSWLMLAYIGAIVLSVATTRDYFPISSVGRNLNGLAGDRSLL